MARVLLAWRDDVRWRSRERHRAPSGYQAGAHTVPWIGPLEQSFDEDVWELYDTNTDWTQSNDLAATHPAKLAELQRQFLIEATKYNVVPLDDRSFERFNSDLAGRPQLIKDKTHLKGGTVSLFIDGEQDGEGRIDRTVPMLFGTDTCDVGSDASSPVSPDYGPKDNAFNGTVNWVQFDIDENAEDLDHLITPEERYKVAIARQ